MQRPVSTPAGYKRHKPPKSLRPEIEARRPSKGRLLMCQGCYRAAIENVDHVCQRCLGDLNRLAKLDQEISKIFPKLSKLTMPETFEAIWKAYKKLRGVA